MNALEPWTGDGWGWWGAFLAIGALYGALCVTRWSRAALVAIAVFVLLTTGHSIWTTVIVASAVGLMTSIAYDDAIRERLGLSIDRDTD